MTGTGRTHDFVVVSSRLPVDAVTGPDGSVVWRRSPGGVAAVLRDVLPAQAAWVGWSGREVQDADGLAGAGADAPDVEDMSLYPVPTTPDDVEQHLVGYCNSTLWPLYHDSIERSEFRESWWHSYQAVNVRFADVAARVAGPGATVWVHDYQLQLVPAMLREQRPDVRIGFFLHTPFPSAELFMQLPHRSEIVRGMLGADLVGFQRPLPARNFLNMTRLVLGNRTRGDRVEQVDGRTVTVRSFPISIDMEPIERLARDPAVRERAEQIRVDLGQPSRVLLGIDRLDYTKGIEQRMRAYGELLAAAQLSPGTVSFVQFAPPSRERSVGYRELRGRVERMTGHLNGRFGEIGAPVVTCLFRPTTLAESVALYLAADVMLVTPFRDGMNLIAKEYVASRVDNGGTLVLSEFAGAAGELRQAYLVNPYDLEALKGAMLRAINVDKTEASRRMMAMRRYLRSRDAHAWRESFFTALDEVCPRR